ncbi:MAG: hypothetical protein K5768_10625 [Firmicutes bacterium]|nr:hypothetical protein [Bacillota bacterium]
MSKAVLVPTKPEYCHLIARGRKTLELRTRIPKQNPPYKCYIYCTSSDVHKCLMQNESGIDLIRCINYKTAISCGGYIVNGKVIGEYICDNILRHCESSNADIAEQQGCVKREWIFEYSKGEEVKGMHISDLIIYDKPKELNAFYRKCEKMPCEGCEHLKYQRVNSNEYDFDCEYFGYKIPITRPPQSWCYVEEFK